MKFIIPIIFVLLSSGCTSNNNYGAAPNGGFIVVPSKPLWVFGTQEEKHDETGYTTTFPKRQVSEHLKVVNSGYWLNFQNGTMEPIYEFTLSVLKPFSEKVYTRTTLENPLNQSAPFTYEHYLLPKEKSTKATHGPVYGVEANKTYILRYEVYKDENRTILVDKIEQRIQAFFDNTSGCIVLEEQLKLKFLPFEKSVWPCKKP